MKKQVHLQVNEFLRLLEKNKPLDAMTLQTLKRNVNESQTVTGFIGQILDCFSQDFDTEELAPLKHTITLRTCHPFDADASDNLKQALFCFFEMLTQQVNGNIRISRKSINQSEDLWKIEDTGSWLW